MLSRSIGAFAAHPGVDDILVVIHPDDAALYAAASEPHAKRLRRAVQGGARRQDSVRAGLEALASEAPSSVLIHDAARPFVSAELITRVIGTLDAHQGALSRPSRHRYVEVGRARAGGRHGRARSALARPDAARFPNSMRSCRASRRGKEPAREFTDDAGVAEWFGLDVALVEGAEDNRKLTTPEDLRRADELLKPAGGRRATIRVAQAMTCTPSVPAMR